MAAVLCLLVFSLPAPAAMLIEGGDPSFNHRFADDPNFIAAAYDLSGLARSSSNRWGTLVSSNVFFASEHWRPATGNTLTFFATNDPLGESTVRTVIGGQRIGSSDIWVGILDQSLPAQYSPLPFIDEPILNSTQFGNSSIFNQEVYMVGRSDNSGASVTNVAFGRNVVDRWNPSVSLGNTTDSAIEAIKHLPGDPGFVQHEAFLQTGDSSAPVLQVVDGQLKIVGLNWYIITDFDVDPHPVKTELVDLNGFSYVGNYAPQIQAVIDAFQVDATSGYLAWAPSAFGGLTDLAQIGPSLDFDKDGLINFMEYAFVLDTQSNSSLVPAFLSIHEDSGQQYFDLSFSVRDDPDLQYALRLGSDLLGWTSLELIFNSGSWSSSDPGLVSVVTQSSPGAGVWSLTLRGTAPLISGVPQFMAVGAEVAP